MDISPALLEKYRRSAREREAARKALISLRRERAWELAQQAASILKIEFGAKRVALFGSLLHPELYHTRSDIDLAVWDVQHYFKAVARLIDLDPEIEFDLVPVEDARPGILALIEKEGVDI
jgi:predicted nucleotidyltransferase